MSQGNYYTATANDSRRYPPLADDLRAGVAIIGGGFTGVATAVELAERGVDVVLLEARRIGWGASGRNGGQVTGSLSGEPAMRRQLTRRGQDAAAFIEHLRWRGHAIIRERIERHGIDCDLKTGHLHTAWSKRHVPALQAAVRVAHRNGLEKEVSWLDRDEVHARLGTRYYHGGVLNRRNLHLHSLNLCLGEARAASALGARLYEESAVRHVEEQPGKGVVLKTAQGRVRADSVVLAGNAYHHLLEEKLGGLLFPATLGNLTTEPLDTTTLAQVNRDDLAVYDSRTVLDYYRITGDARLMFGGGTSYSGRQIPDVAATLRPSLEATFPGLRGVGIDYAWSGAAGIVINRIPLVGRTSHAILHAQGYSGHGLATSHVVAEMLAEALTGNAQSLDTFSGFSHRRVPGSRRVGNGLIALGMQYYRMRERLGL